MLTVLLCIHVLTAIIAFGPTFAFPFLGFMSQREPQYANVLGRATELIATRLVVPVGLTQLVTGVLIILVAGLDLTKNAWLGVSIILYLAAMSGAIFHQVPTGAKLVHLTAPDGEGPPPIAEIQRLAGRLRMVGMLMTLALIVIVILMVWRPGFTA